MLGRMRNSRRSLFIPRLSYQGKTISISTSSRAHKYHLYKLDWTDVDSIKKCLHHEWLSRHTQQTANTATPITLPYCFDVIITNLYFALSSNYLNEIRHYTQLYYIEWHRERPFDTVIREMCLRPAISAINCAIKLIADCIYDDVNGCWLRNKTIPLSDTDSSINLDKSMLKCLLLYKFWRQNTGDGLVWEHSELDKLEERAQSQTNPNRLHKSGLEQSLAINQLLTTLRNWEANQDKLRSFCSIKPDQINNSGDQES